MVFGNVVTKGLDRPIACDLWSSSNENPTAQSVSIFGNLLGNSVEGSLVGIAGHMASSTKEGYVSIFGNVGFGSHKSFCHVRGPNSIQNVSIPNNVSLQKAENLDTEDTIQTLILASSEQGNSFRSGSTSCCSNARPRVRLYHPQFGHNADTTTRCSS